MSGVDLGRDVEGKRQRVVRNSKTEAEAIEKLNHLLGEHGKGLVTPTDRQTVGEYLDHWLEFTTKPNIRPRTYDDYAAVIAQHLKPSLGKHTLQKLTAQYVQAMISAKQ